MVRIVDNMQACNLVILLFELSVSFQTLEVRFSEDLSTPKFCIFHLFFVTSEEFIQGMLEESKSLFRKVCKVGGKWGDGVTGGQREVLLYV